MLNKLKSLSVIGLLSVIISGSNAYAQDNQRYITVFLAQSKNTYTAYKLEDGKRTAELNSNAYPTLNINIGFSFNTNTIIESSIFVSQDTEKDSKDLYNTIRGYLVYKMTDSNQSKVNLYGKIGLGVSYNSIAGNTTETTDNGSEKTIEGVGTYLLPSLLLEFGADYQLKDNIFLNIKAGLAGVMSFIGLGISYHF